MMRYFLLIGIILILASSCSKEDRYLDFGSDRVYYVAPVKEETAQKIGTFLQEYQYFIGNGAVVQLVQDSSLVARFATRPGIEQDAYIIDGFVDMQLEMSLSVLDGGPIDFQLCDSTLTTKGTITFSDARAWIEGKAYVEK
jgi:hypothetical protein